MNIGIVTAWFESGAGYVSRLYLDTLAKRHNVFIYARGGEYAPKDLEKARTDPNWNPPYVTWGKKSIPFVLTAIDLDDLQKWVESCNIELVIFNEQWNWPPVVLCNKLEIKTGAYVDYYNEDTIPLFDAYDFLLCNTRRHYSVFDWHPQCIYIPWGTALDLFKPHSLEPVRAGNVTFFHSSYHGAERKGTDLVIKAFAELPEQAILIVHTKAELKEVFPSLKTTVENLERSGRLISHHETVSAPGLYHLGDVYVYPSRLEGIGLTIAEALACGLPVITSNNPPMNEFVEHGKNGRLVAIDRLVARPDGYYWPKCYPNMESLREQMNYYIDNINDLKLFKTQARAWAEAKMDWGKNSAFLSERVTNIAKRPRELLEQAGQKALVYETQHGPLYQRFPKTYALLRAGNFVVKGLRRIFR